MQPGYIATYAISTNYTLATEPIKTAAMFPFSLKKDIDNNGVYLVTDVITGFGIYQSGPNAKLVQGNIFLHGAVGRVFLPDEQANALIFQTCWTAQSPLTKSMYVVDTTGKRNITEISMDASNLQCVCLIHLRTR